MLMMALMFLNIFHVADTVRELPYITLLKRGSGGSVYELKISQPHVKVYEADQYFCFTRFLEELTEAYVLASRVEYDSTFIHHVSTGFCDEPEVFAKNGPWECSSNRDSYCLGSAVTGIAVDDFTKESNKATTFPKDFSIKIGALARLRYFTYESHFKSPITELTYPVVNITLTFVKSPTKYYFQSFMMFTSGYIPARKEQGYFAEVACQWKKPKIAVFGVHLHAHHYGIMAELFRIRNGTWTLLANQLTQGKSKNLTPIIGGFVDIKPGDILAAKCLYVNNGNNPIKFGLTDTEEMCNVDLSFGYELKDDFFFIRPGACGTHLPEFSLCNHKETAAICGMNKVIA